MKDLSFERNVKPLFSEWHRSEMDWIFDLWSCADVSHRANQILDRLEDQTMPCDIPLSPEQIEVFRRWVRGGCAP